MGIYYGKGRYAGGYKGTDEDVELHYYALKKINPLRNIAGAFDDDLHVEGRHLDACYYRGWDLAEELFPDTATATITDYMRVWGVTSLYEPNDAVVARMRTLINKDGRLTKAYMESVIEAYGFTGAAASVDGVVSGLVSGGVATFRAYTSSGVCRLNGVNGTCGDTFNTVDASDATYDRIDALYVVSPAEWNTTSRPYYPGFDVVIATGTPTASPVVPPSPYGSSRYSTILCEILVPAGSSSYTELVFTDRRTYYQEPFIRERIDDMFIIGPTANDCSTLPHYVRNLAACWEWEVHSQSGPTNAIIRAQMEAHINRIKPAWSTVYFYYDY